MSPHPPSLLERMRERGYRITPPRRAVLRVLERERAHLHPDEVFARARALYPALGRATVYRTLELLTDIGLTRPIYLGGGRPAITVLAGGHHHMVCSGCDRVIEIAAQSLQTAARRLARKAGFEVHSQLLELYGLCARCREKTA